MSLNIETRKFSTLLFTKDVTGSSESVVIEHENNVAVEETVDFDINKEDRVPRRMAARDARAIINVQTYFNLFL